MSERTMPGFASLGLFTGVSQVNNFGLAELLPSVEMAASSQPRPWPAGEQLEAPRTFGYLGHQERFEDGFLQTETSALLLLRSSQSAPLAITGAPAGRSPIDPLRTSKRD